MAVDTFIYFWDAGGVRRVGVGGGGQQFVTQSQVNMFTAKSQNLCIAPIRGFKTFVTLLTNVCVSLLHMDY
jgi:hypothetical protein